MGSSHVYVRICRKDVYTMSIVQKKEISFDSLCIRTYRSCGYVGGCLSNVQSIEFFGNSSRYFLGLNANAPRSFYFRLQTTLYLIAVPPLLSFRHRPPPPHCPPLVSNTTPDQRDNSEMPLPIFLSPSLRRRRA